MTALQVRKKLAEKFTDLSESGFTYLDREDVCLSRCDADINGEMAIKRRGALYICQCTKVLLFDRLYVHCNSAS